MEKLECCIFDLDGVIVDTAKYHFLSWKELSDRLKINFTEEKNEELKGISRMKSLEIILQLGGKRIDKKTKKALTHKKNQIYLAYIQQLTPKEILPGVKKLIDELKNNNIKVALGSASKNSRLVLEKIELVHHFDIIIDGNDVKRSKPNPEVFTKTADLLNIPSKNCVVFEDSASGIDAALNAGMQVIGIGTSTNLKKANHTIHNFKNMSLKEIQKLLIPNPLALQNPISEWEIIEQKFDKKKNKASESLFSIGNGKMGQRANFEEHYSGETMQGSYISGIYYPDKTRVGWWKNGYPNYFAKVLNSVNWIGINIEIEGIRLDLSKCKVIDFERILNMKAGYLERNFTVEISENKKIKIQTQRFLSIVNDELGAIKYSLTPLNFSGKAMVTPYLDTNVKNQDANYDEKFWEHIPSLEKNDEKVLIAKTKKTNFYVSTSMGIQIYENEKKITYNSKNSKQENYLAEKIDLTLKKNRTTHIYKYAAIVSSLYYSKEELAPTALHTVKLAEKRGFEQLQKEQAQAWANIWAKSDIKIEGDLSAQQAIRFNIFQLNQTYTGRDPRLNIGPKGFTGEKYGGSTYWDTEAYCLPFYLYTEDSSVAKNLLLYRYKHLDKAIENAEKLGFKNGAALYPMVTMNGEECHNEWEITFEEIHRNGIIAYAIYKYVNHTNDKNYLIDYGLKVLIAISRFWKQRITFSQEKKKYVMLGVTGPNEYENNVNNNWYTNLIAVWTLKYSLATIDDVKKTETKKYKKLCKEITFQEKIEIQEWKNIASNMYFPFDEEEKIFLQQDGYKDKEQILVTDLPKTERPINQNWSWDRILRSCFIKQADVLQGIYLFEDRYDIDTIKRNFHFYEQRTVHESSLSPCIHSILAAKIGDMDKAYEMYLQTARLDLDDHNYEIDEGCHITSMAGTWLTIVEGFAGLRIRKGTLSLSPQIPKQWEHFSFNILFRKINLTIKIKKQNITIFNRSNTKIPMVILDKKYMVKGNAETNITC